MDKNRNELIIDDTGGTPGCEQTTTGFFPKGLCLGEAFGEPSSTHKKISDDYSDSLKLNLDPDNLPTLDLTLSAKLDNGYTGSCFGWNGESY